MPDYLPEDDPEVEDPTTAVRVQGDGPGQQTTWLTATVNYLARSMYWWPSPSTVTMEMPGPPFAYFFIDTWSFALAYVWAQFLSLMSTPLLSHRKHKKKHNICNIFSHLGCFLLPQLSYNNGLFRLNDPGFDANFAATNHHSSPLGRATLSECNIQISTKLTKSISSLIWSAYRLTSSFTLHRLFST